MDNIIRKCPTCNESVEFNKKRLINCRCGADLISFKIGKRFLIEDVTVDDKIASSKKVVISHDID